MIAMVWHVVGAKHAGVPMFHVTKINDSRLDLILSGKIGSSEMDAGLDDLMALSDGLRGAGLFYHIADFRWPAIGVVTSKISRLPELTKLFGRFAKVAVVSDRAWIRTFATLEGKLIPTLQIKGFAPEDRQTAEAWLADNEIFDVA